MFFFYFSDVAPIWTPKSLSVYPQVDFDITVNPNYYFTCSFTPAVETLLYKIEWFVNSKEIKNTGYLPESDLLHSGRLKESELISNGFKLNIMVRCGFRHTVFIFDLYAACMIILQQAVKFCNFGLQANIV